LKELGNAFVPLLPLISAAAYFSNGRERITASDRVQHSLIYFAGSGVMRSQRGCMIKMIEGTHPMVSLLTFALPQA
jgi:hypothetical protein